jgi:hypothetical protein
VEALPKAQRNALFEAVAASGLPVSDFSLKAVSSFFPDAPKEALITHVPSGSEFQIFPERDSSFFTCCSQIVDDPLVSLNYRMNFGEVASHVLGWGRELAEWLNSADLWKSVPEAAAIPGELTPESDNTQFTPEEQKVISDQLKAIAETVKKDYDLTAEQSAKLDEKFEEAEKASRRMGRKDWGLLFGGAVFSLILADVITPGVAGHILMMIEHGLGHLFGGPPVGGILSDGRN